MSNLSQNLVLTLTFLCLQASDIVAQKASKGRSKGSQIIECEICSKRFRYQSDLKNHFESHFRQPGKR